MHTKKHPFPRPLIKFASILGTVAALVLPALPARASNNAPTLKLFPTTVVENIKETGESARAMEESLQGVVQDLEKQMALYSQSKCDGALADEGCQEIARQMSNTYLAMLDRMEERFPELEVSVKATKNSLEKQLRRELGRKQTPRGLQKLMSDQATEASRLPKRKNARLSEKFRQYFKLVSLGGSKVNSGSLMTLASEIYLDTTDVLDLVAMTKEEMGRARLLIQLNQMYGIITPEMQNVVAGVKEIIFGEMESEPLVPDMPLASDARAYQSPLAR